MMGTWGEGNLQSDGALDELADRSQKLIGELMERARKKTSREADEWEHDALFVDFEIVFALDAKDLISIGTLPDAKEVEQLKLDYLRDWDAYIDELQPKDDYKQRRRDVIAKTFDTFKEICIKRKLD